LRIDKNGNALIWSLDHKKRVRNKKAFREKKVD